EKIQSDRNLAQRVDEPCGDDLNLIDFFLQEEVASEGRNAGSLREMRRVCVFEFGDQLSADATHKFGSLSPGRNKDRRLLVKLGGHAIQVAVECATQTLVGADQDDRSLVDRVLLQQGMRKLSHPGRRFALNPVQQVGKWASRQSCLLCLAHLRGRYHLHGFGNLRSAADGAYASPEITNTMHISAVQPSLPRLFELVSRRLQFRFQGVR